MQSPYVLPVKRVSKPAVILLVGILFLAAFFRFSNLGYSEFQGDEVKVQEPLFSNESFRRFLLSRTVGPGQFVVAYLVNVAVRPPANYEFWVRLPFALASFLTLIGLYFFAKKFLNTAAAHIVLLLAGLSGFLISFSRFVQYQSFVLLFSMLAVYTFSSFFISSQSKLLFVSGFLGGLGLLFHYDALSFVIPMVITLLIMAEFKKLVYFIIPVLLVVLPFFIPLVFSAEFSETWRYLIGRRIVTYFPFDSLYYSLNLLSIYHSRESLFFLLLGIILWLIGLSKKQAKIFSLFFLALVVTSIIRVLGVSPRRLFIYPSIVSLVAIIWVRLRNFKRDGFKPIDFVELWFLFSFLIYGLYIRKPLTHIYNFLIPLFLIVSWHYSKLLKRYATLLILIILVTVVSSVSFNYQAFIETKTEYPWEKEAYIFGKMFSKMATGEKWDGIFGFPHRSSWLEIRDKLQDLKEETGIYHYSTNEKYKLVRYYLRDFSSSDAPPYYFIYVKNPHSLDFLTPTGGELVIERENYSIFEMR